MYHGQPQRSSGTHHSLENQPSRSYYAYPSQAPYASPAATTGTSFPQQTRLQEGRASREEVLHTWTQEGQITASESLSDSVITVQLADGRYAYRCGRPECRRVDAFTTKSTVISHIRSVHLQERPFICNTCHATFGRKQDADRHCISKNQGKVYQCRYCSEVFSRKDYLSGVHEICCTARPASRR